MCRSHGSGAGEAHSIRHDFPGLLHDECDRLRRVYDTLRTGAFQLLDPVSKFIPAFRNLEAYDGEENSGSRLVDPHREITIRDLLTHTSGVTYHFLEYGSVVRLGSNRIGA